MFLFFFFQAEDGIRDKLVTEFRRVLFRSRRAHRGAPGCGRARCGGGGRFVAPVLPRQLPPRAGGRERVGWGKRGDLGGRRILKKKKKKMERMGIHVSTNMIRVVRLCESVA